VYGSIGVAAATNVPGSRSASASLTDSSNNFWLFGGQGYDSIGSNDALNDLWRYSPASGQWTWVGGSDTGGAAGVYGNIGVASAGNIPGARAYASSWTDSSGYFWLFGGGYSDYSTSPIRHYFFNDLWKYKPATTQWTWVSGSSTPNATGAYGVMGVASAGNVPGARSGALSWVDSTGNFWLFGGATTFSLSTVQILNDLWKYNPTSNQWTWVSGSDAADASGSYGILGVASTNNVPGARSGGASWIDSSGNLWLFGGQGYDSTGTQSDLNDLWKYNPTSNQWTWVSGSNVGNAPGIYGTVGIAAASNVPGGREVAASWIDSSGNLWLSGGRGYDSTGTNNYLNDLWKYNPTSNQWTWLAGSNTANALGVYGSIGVASANNVPGARDSSNSWIDLSGNLWLFGGSGFGSINTVGDLNDIWRFGSVLDGGSAFIGTSNGVSSSRGRSEDSASRVQVPGKAN